MLELSDNFYTQGYLGCFFMERIEEKLSMKFYSNEIIFRGHSDKACDQIGDVLLDAYLKGDKNSRYGIEVAGGKARFGHFN